MAAALGQFGSLGSGNHFVEICLDESDTVWLFLHSGSRGVGHQLAEQHIAVAKQLHHLAADRAELDPDLAWLEQGTTEFDAYIADMTWAQSYAAGNRAAMLAAVEEEFFDFVGAGTSVQAINCHHNFAARERHGDTELWITRKGAIRADRGDLGLIPGSMGDRSFVVRGLGNPLSWNSCSHGAGRRLSRSAAKKAFTPAELAVQMGDRTWLADHAAALIDEIPAAYKPIDEVMAAQTDLVEVVHALRQVLNYKGC
jgi:tRNA-splicing ligase RtcB